MEGGLSQTELKLLVVAVCIVENSLYKITLLFKTNDMQTHFFSY